MNRSSFLALSLLSLVLSLCPESAPARAQNPTRGVQHFVCNVGYTPAQCHAQMTILRDRLAQYPTSRLGDWTWVLVRSQDWNRLKRQMELDPDSPAFSSLSRRQTFFEEALVAPVPGRSAELIVHWQSSMGDLLTLAVTHELGHALCAESDERKADRYGALLRAGTEVRCHR